MGLAVGRSPRAIFIHFFLVQICEGANKGGVFLDLFALPNQIKGFIGIYAHRGCVPDDVVEHNGK